jgi:hypothetical protein
MPLYASSHPLLCCLRAALTDTALTLAAVIVARRTTVRHSHAFWPTLIGLLLSAGATIETLALAGGHWSYSSAMPTVGDVGLVALLQLAFIATVALGLAGRLDRAPKGLAAVTGRRRRTPATRG